MQLARLSNLGHRTERLDSAPAGLHCSTLALTAQHNTVAGGDAHAPSAPGLQKLKCLLESNQQPVSCSPNVKNLLSNGGGWAGQDDHQNPSQRSRHGALWLVQPRSSATSTITGRAMAVRRRIAHPFCPLPSRFINYYGDMVVKILHFYIKIGCQFSYGTIIAELLTPQLSGKRCTWQWSPPAGQVGELPAGGKS